jgi:hypothetical protein
VSISVGRFFGVAGRVIFLEMVGIFGVNGINQGGSFGASGAPIGVATGTLRVDGVVAAGVAAGFAVNGCDQTSRVTTFARKTVSGFRVTVAVTVPTVAVVGFTAAVKAPIVIPVNNNPSVKILIPRGLL